MSTLETMRTLQPAITVRPARTTLAPDTTSLHDALQDAAITIPLTAGQRAMITATCGLGLLDTSVLEGDLAIRRGGRNRKAE